MAHNGASSLGAVCAWHIGGYSPLNSAKNCEWGISSGHTRVWAGRRGKGESRWAWRAGCGPQKGNWTYPERILAF
eukprot:537028-Amorphochlora_amoeboformis.AAC.1